jgi:hypothetical protein
MPLAIRIQGALDAHALEQAVTEVVRRQPALRTTFALDDGEPVQRIAPAYDVPLPVADLTSDPDRERTLARLVAEAARRPFDLARGPLLTTTLVRLAADDHVLLATAHHLIVDAWSAAIITRDTAACYGAFVAGRPPALPPLPQSYAETVRRQLDTVARHEADELAYWSAQLRDVPPLRLADRGASCLPGTDRHSFDVPRALLAEVEALARREEATPFAVLLATSSAASSTRSRSGRASIRGRPFANCSPTRATPCARLRRTSWCHGSASSSGSTHRATAAGCRCSRPCSCCTVSHSRRQCRGSTSRGA